MPSTPTPPPIEKGLATKSLLGTTILAFIGGVANLAAGGPLEQTVTLLGGGFATIITMAVGRYWQASKVPPIVVRVAQIADRLLEQSQPRVAPPPSDSVIAPAPIVPPSPLPDSPLTPPSDPPKSRRDRHKT